MCTVQVLLFADVVRRTGGVSYNNNNNNNSLPRSICRRLFADDHCPQSRPALLKTLEAELEKEVKDRWNFDFRAETPLPGRYQWEAVRSGAQGRVPRADSVVAEVSQTTKETSEKRPTITQKKSSHRNKSTTQSKITDFLQQRKRHRTMDSDLSSPNLKSRRLQTDSTTSEEVGHSSF